MAFTQQDLAAVQQAIATGELTVRTANGQSVTYRSIAELKEARNLIEADMAAQSAARQSRVRPIRYVGF